MKIVMNVDDLRELIKDLPGNMPVRGMDDETPLMFVCEYDDIPDGQHRPSPTLYIEL